MSHISFVLPGFARRPTGGYKIVYAYSNFLVEQGHSVSILQFRPVRAKDASANTLKRLAIASGYFLMRSRRPTWFRLDPRVHLVNNSRLDEKLVRRSDVIVATSVKTAHFVDRLCEKRGVRGAYLIQHFEDFTLPAEFVEETWHLPLRRIVVSPWLRDRAERLGLDATLVQNGIDDTEFLPGPPVAQRPVSVLALVSAEPWKRTDLVAQSMREVLRAFPTARLRTFGTCPRPSGLPVEVEHVENPNHAMLRGMYQEARIFLCASDVEGFGLPVGEAMMSGCAVVSTRNGGVESFAGDGVKYVRTGDAASMATAILQLLREPAALEELADSGLAHIRRHTSKNAAAEFAIALLGERQQDQESSRSAP